MLFPALGFGFWQGQYPINFRESPAVLFQVPLNQGHDVLEILFLVNSNRSARVARLRFYVHFKFRADDGRRADGGRDVRLQFFFWSRFLLISRDDGLELGEARLVSDFCFLLELVGVLLFFGVLFSGFLLLFRSSDSSGSSLSSRLVTVLAVFLVISVIISVVSVKWASFLARLGPADSNLISRKSRI